MAVHRSDVVNTLASSGGAVLATTFHMVGRVRQTPKPLHPRGRLVHGTLVRLGLNARSGVRWLDEPGVDEILARQSRATGLPASLPDIHGLAVRVPVGPGRHGDLLFATTGTGRLTRFMLTIARSGERRPQTTLLPYRTPSGPMLLAALPAGQGHFELACASPTGDWRAFGDLTLEDDPLRPVDPTISFDPMLNTIPKLEPYEWARRLRAGAYAEARRTR